MAVIYTPQKYIKKTQEVLSKKVSIFETFPICIKNIITERMWAKVNDRYGKPFESFEAFCIHELWEGLELKTDELLSYLKKAPDVKALVLGELEEAGSKDGAPFGVKNNPNGLGGKSGKTIDNLDNIKVINKEDSPPKKNYGGTSPTYLTKRLKRDNPDLFNKVKSGELSAHKAAVMAGIKKPMIQIRSDDPVKAAEQMKAKFSAEFIKKLKSEL